MADDGDGPDAAGPNHRRMMIRTFDYHGDPMTEAIWVVADHETYIVDNIPIYATGLALGDRVSGQRGPTAC